MEQSHIVKKLVFLHGWATDASVWRRQMSAFSGEYRCLPLTLPGHGNGATWAAPTLAPAVDSLLRSIEECAPEEDLVAIGWSLGAQVILRAALMKPEYFRGMVLIGATPCFVKRNDFPWGQSRGVTRRMSIELKRDFFPTLNGFYSLNFTEDELETSEAETFIHYFHERSEHLHRDSLLQSLDALIAADLRNEVKAMTLPTLIVHGDDDRVVPPGAGAYLAEQIAQAQFERFRKTGHIPFLTEAERFNTIVQRFLERL
ncbi:MAG: alpha/beta fold hydrolase [Thermodesulfobacteriota bacterium]